MLMNRAEKRRKYTAQEVALRCAIARKQGEDYATKCIYPAVLIVLHDEFGFGKKRAERFIKRTLLQAAAVKTGQVSYEDIVKQVQEEIKVDIE